MGQLFVICGEIDVGVYVMCWFFDVDVGYCFDLFGFVGFEVDFQCQVVVVVSFVDGFDQFG